DRNLAAVEQGFDITIARRGNQLSLHGETEGVEGAEAALREAEKNYRSIFDNAPIGIYRSTPGGELRKANPVLTRLLGHTNEPELISALRRSGRDIYVDPKRRETFTDLLQRDGVVTNFESEIRRVGAENEEPIWVSENAHLVRDDLGEVQFFEGTIEDITARVEAAKELSRFRVVVDASQEAIAIAGLDGMLIYANRAHQQLFGHPPLHRKPRHWYDSFPPTGVSQFEAEVLPELERNQGWEGVMDAVDSTGKKFTIWGRTDTINDENGVPQLVFALMHDYTSEIEMRNELREARDRAQDANKAKSEFLVTHRREEF
ncbi:MAG: PAS domain S-box protein, partial [Pseudomonadota bacterium]